jgi:serine/threonine protein kinase
VHEGLDAGRWRIGEIIGRGAVADVHLGLDSSTGATVAIKVLRHADPDQRARFEREAIALESLDDPGIVRVLGHGSVDGRPFLVLEHVEGGSLADRLAAGPLPPEEVATLGATLAAALTHAHARGIVHRDVKPSNVLLDAHGSPRLADFGVAQLDGSASLTATGFTVGTAGYLAPEQVRGEPVGPPADVYALGLVLLEALTGERAYPGTGIAAAMARLERPPAVPETVAPELAGQVRAMTRMAPDARPSMTAAAAALAGFASSSTSGGTAILPIVDDPTEVVAVAAAAPVPNAVPRPPARRPVHVGWQPVAVAVGCFAAGFLAVAALGRALGAGSLDLDELRPPPATTVTTATLAPSTTAPPTSAPTTAPAPPDDRDRRGEGRGHRGRGDDD